MGVIIKAARAVLLPRWQPQGIIDLTQPGSDRTREARQAAVNAGAVIAGKAPM